MKHFVLSGSQTKKGKLVLRSRHVRNTVDRRVQFSVGRPKKALFKWRSLQVSVL